MPHLVPKSTFLICAEIIIHAPCRYFTLAAPRRGPSFFEGAFDGAPLATGVATLAVVGAIASGPLRTTGGAPPLEPRLRPSRKLCQTTRIGLAIKTDE